MLVQTRFFYTSRLPAAQRIGPHNQDVVSTLVGNLLGDSWGEKPYQSSRFHFHMASRNVDYLHWLHQFYTKRGYCSPEKPKPTKQIGKGGKIYFSYKWRTWSFSSLNWLYDSFYTICPKTGKTRKRIPLLIEELLTPRALAVWIMDHGSAANAGVLISTEGFEIQDLEILQRALKNKFFLTTTLQRGLYFPKSECFELVRLVKPFMVASMMYKLHNTKFG
jgi:hypothetical protein